jgi:hypothetical protein
MNDNDKPFRMTISLASHVRDLLDDLCERSGLDRPAVIALLIQDAADNPRSPFLERAPRSISHSERMYAAAA